jgi:phosphopantetheinyl transferase (holo-ACP synthase)
MTLMQQEILRHFKNLKTKVMNTFEGEIPETVKELYPGKKRVRLHYTSRLALINAINSDEFKTYEDVEIENHQFLKRDPSIKVSLSHTDHKALASVSSCEEVLSIGVDLESEDRPIKEGIKKFYIRDEDEIENELELWCIKEAAFKAISPLYKGDKRLVLKDIIVLKDESFKLELNSNLDGYWKLEKSEGEILTFAIILKSR